MVKQPYATLEIENAPPWLVEYAQDCRRLFGIGDDWYISVKLVRAPDGDINKEGHSRINIRYLTAHIELCESLSEEGLRHTCMHELFHIAFAPLELAHLRILDLVPEELREHANELQADGIEQTIERLTRSIERTIKPTTTTTAAEN